jgi:hypothetical protein
LGFTEYPDLLFPSLYPADDLVMDEHAVDNAEWIDQLNQEYETLHTQKEDAFWASYMGLTEDPDHARQELSQAEIRQNRWLQDPERLREVRRRIKAAGLDAREPSNDKELGLWGWQHTLQAHAIESEEGRSLSEKVIELETDLAGARAKMPLGYQLPNQELTRASSVELGTLLRSSPDENLRHAAWQGLRSIEDFVLDNGFIEVVKQRNRLGKMLGGEDYYDWQTRRVEGMPKAEIFALLDELEIKTRDSAQHAVALLREQQGEEITPWNVQFLVSGDVTQEMDPYFPFATAFDVWGRSFTALGADFRKARLVLDLLDRAGKYENGFMHGPVPAWRTPTGFQPARIHFTANAIPHMIGSGQRGLETFFHEGGHAIHFANIDMPSPSFAQEFAPTSVAYAEIQSMIMDSLIGDADWLSLYARTQDGARMPFELIEKSIRAKQPFAAWMTRAMLVVPYAEKAIYELPESELSADRILEVCRDVERRLLGLDQGSFRPVLSVPHLLSGEASAYYHGYVLAEMGVEQTRQFIIQRDGFLVDNPQLAPTLCESYWKPGNRYGLHDYLQRMTGERLKAGPLADRVNRSSEEALAQAQASYDRVAGQDGYQGPVDMNASIALIHGRQTIADTESMPFAEAAKAFATFIQQHSAASEAKSDA